MAWKPGLLRRSSPRPVPAWVSLVVAQIASRGTLTNPAISSPDTASWLSRTGPAGVASPPVTVEEVHVIVRMWEARAYPEGFDDLLGWVCDVAVPAVEVHPRHIATEVFSSTDHRLVVVSRWRGSEPQPLPDPPGHLVARAPHWWDFTLVDR